ncbi:MAG: hypothetical protein OXC30_04615 [Alphaproteobacteria bacterium]|nr:hypothetical protein [Alphaproteobacteria bacterium]
MLLLILLFLTCVHTHIDTLKAAVKEVYLMSGESAQTGEGTPIMLEWEQSTLKNILEHLTPAKYMKMNSTDQLQSVATPIKIVLGKFYRTKHHAFFSEDLDAQFRSDTQIFPSEKVMLYKVDLSLEILYWALHLLYVKVLTVEIFPESNRESSIGAYQYLFESLRHYCLGNKNKAEEAYSHFLPLVRNLP